MKSEDFERLKAVCEKEGFDVELSSPWDQTYRISKKDIWKGVEFAKCTCSSPSYTVGKIYKIHPVKYQSIKTYQDDLGRENGLSLYFFKPSTESAYIEQLKAEAFKMFGEIKAGDTFIDHDNDFIRSCNNGIDNWFYSKDKDILFAFGARIYQQGKWATRVTERVKVDPDSAISITDAINQCFRKDNKDFSKFLAKQLEEYLNK